MSRRTELIVTPGRTNALVERLLERRDVLTLRVHRAGALRPAGDVIVVQTTTDAVHPLMRLLDEEGVGREDGAVATSQPDSLIVPGHGGALAGERSDATWEEMEHTIASESNMTVTSLGMMALAGVIATMGLATNALHLVIAAMIIAPAFEPISRIALGIVAKGQGWRAGVMNVLRGYLALVAASAAAAAVLNLGEGSVLAPIDSYFRSETDLVEYWTTFSARSLAASAAAALVGALLIVAHRSVLTAGVLVALALVPTAVLVGVGAASAAPWLALMALARLATDMGLVFVASLIVFTWHRRTLQPRASMS